MHLISILATGYTNSLCWIWMVPFVSWWDKHNNEIFNWSGAVASLLVRSSLDQALAGDIVLCSWAKHLTFTLPLSTQVYKWVLASLMPGVTLWWLSIPSREGGRVEILLVASWPWNQDKLRPDGPLGSYADFAYLTYPFLVPCWGNVIWKLFILAITIWRRQSHAIVALSSDCYVTDDASWKINQSYIFHVFRL